MSELAEQVVVVTGSGQGINGRRRNLKTSERIARDIAAYIVDHRLPEGARLPREKEMMEMLGVGRMTLREALRLLETQGVIDIRSGAHGGPVIRRPRPEDLAGTLTPGAGDDREAFDRVSHLASRRTLCAKQSHASHTLTTQLS